MENSKLELLHDHYKETFAYIQDYLKLRDKLFFFILFVITIMLFQIYSPLESGKAVSQFICKKIDMEAPVDVTFVSSIVWFALLSLVVRYFQTVVHIERQYIYIHQIEKLLSAQYDNKVFTREGKSYLKNYPAFSCWAWILYTIIFPALLIIVVVAKIICDIRQTGTIALLQSVNIAIAMCIIVSTLLCLRLVHFKR